MPLTGTFTNAAVGNVTSTLENPTYTMTGVYTVSLTATGPGGADTLTRTNYITVTSGGYTTTTRTITYTYDPLGRLTGADYSTDESFAYAYDAVGNRTAMTDTAGAHTYTYDAANRLTSVDGVTYTWDARGNLVSDGTFTYTYNSAGRMARACRGEQLLALTSTLAYTYTAYGLRVAQSVDGDVTTFAWDWASGIPEMLSDGDNLYLVGHETLGRWDGNDWAYHLPDALGSVRQVADGAGAVVDSREWTPYGVEVGGAQGGLGYTGEWQDPYAEFNYLRARWYAPEVGRFTSKDAWPGDPNQPISYNAWLYGYANPIRWVDRTGLSPRVDCANMPPYLNLRELCEIGNGDDDDPTVLDAREKIFRIMVGGGHLYGLANEGFYWGAEMLEHFLDGNGAPKNIQFSMYDQFPHDSGITRATKEERPPDIAVDEPLHITPLLHEFVYNYIQSAADGGPWFTAFAELHGKDYYYAPNGKDPRPYDTGFWAAFGHVVIDGRFSAIVQHSCTYDGYFAEYTANYLIKDRYAWYPEKNMWTPFDFPFAPGVVQIPHHWEESLTVTNPPRAHEYDFSILWTERERIFIKGDFSYFREVESWEWESQYPHP